jgi:hypothetical protein
VTRVVVYFCKIDNNLLAVLGVGNKDRLAVSSVWIRMSFVGELNLPSIFVSVMSDAEVV